MRQRLWLMVAVILAFAPLAGCAENPIGPGSTQSSFTWKVTPGAAGVLTVTRGTTGTFTIRLDSKVNINSDVSFAVSGNLPPNSTATFAPQRLPSTGRDAALAIQTSAQTPLGTYSFKIIATEIGLGTYEETVRVDVISAVGANDFLLELDPLDITLSDFGGRTIGYYIRPINDFSGTVDISVEGIEVPPAPVVLRTSVSLPQLTFARGDGGQGGTFVIALAQRDVFPQTWRLTVRAASGAIVHTATLNITIRLGR